MHTFGAVSAEKLPPIDGRAWSTYIEQGRAHFDRVVRSRNMFVRNANELVALLTDAEHDVLKALALMGPYATNLGRRGRMLVTI